VFEEFVGLYHRASAPPPVHNRAMLELHDIQAAAGRLAGHVLDTPFVE
jgi:hypothetical protein